MNKDFISQQQKNASSYVRNNLKNKPKKIAEESLEYSNFSEEILLRKIKTRPITSVIVAAGIGFILSNVLG